MEAIRYAVLGVLGAIVLAGCAYGYRHKRNHAARDVWAAGYWWSEEDRRLGPGS